MNISAFTDPLPKNYLNINCHDINCNRIVANSSVVANRYNFVAIQNTPVAVNAGLDTFVTCNATLFTDPAFNLATNTYTAPVSGDYLFNFSTNVETVVAVASLSILCAIIKNGVTYGKNKFLYYTSTALSQKNSICFSELVRLNQGDTVNFRVSNIGSGNASTSETQIDGTLI